ncbi:hypothetical protein PGB90_006907 [Kerria lacca]
MRVESCTVPAACSTSALPSEGIRRKREHCCNLSVNAKLKIFMALQGSDREHHYVAHELCNTDLSSSPCLASLPLL